MEMSTGQRLILSIPCCHCKRENGHVDDCPVVKVKALEARRSSLSSCPKCTVGSLEVNAGDYFECRNCHTQYSTSGCIEGDETFTLADWKRNETIRVQILPHKGEGKFPVDEHERLVKRYTKNYAKKRRL